MKVDPKQAAFPFPPFGPSGITVRQYYAAISLQGLLAGGVWDILDPTNIAGTAFKLADAMIAFENEEDKE